MLLRALTSIDGLSEQFNERGRVQVMQVRASAKKDEKERLSRMNILVATPGRLLQHMDQTVGFECDNLQLLGKSPVSKLASVYSPYFSFGRGRSNT